MGIENWSESIILVNLAPEPQMSEELRTVIEISEDRGECDVVIDFAGVEIVTSSSIAKLLKLRKTLKDKGHRLVLSGMSVQTKGVFMDIDFGFNIKIKTIFLHMEFRVGPEFFGKSGKIP